MYSALKVGSNIKPKLAFSYFSWYYFIYSAYVASEGKGYSKLDDYSLFIYI